MNTTIKPKLSLLSSKHLLKTLPDRFYLHPSPQQYSSDPCKILNSPTSLEASKLSLESKSLLQQRRAIRDLINTNSPQSSTNLNKSSLQVIGKSQSFETLKYNFSPVHSYASREILKPIVKCKTSIVEERRAKLDWKRESAKEKKSTVEEDKRSKRKVVTLDWNNLDISETEEPDESIQFTARYN